MVASNANIFYPSAPRCDDHASIHANGMWYQSWQSGYDDILKRGLAKPQDKRTIFAELHSPNCPAFLHGGCGNVPFLVTEQARGVLEASGLTGFDFAPVVVAKIATLGKRKRKSTRGEPEDVVLKSRGIDLNLAPKLFAVYVSGRWPVSTDHESGKSPKGWISPFQFAGDFRAVDLFQPEYRGAAFSAWCFCSEKFKNVCAAHKLTNITFEHFREKMDRFREDLARRESQSG